MMRFFYMLAVYCVTPLMFLFWVVRGCRNRSYFDRLGQRFGIGIPRIAGESGALWVHAVSVGEVQAAVPLIRSLLNSYPGRKLVVTTVTPTGAQRVASLFGESVVHAYVPFETSGAVRRFFDRIRPAIAIVMETEIWPNLYNECGIRGVPLVLASARISPRSVARYRRLVPLFREALSHGIVIAAQSEADAERFKSLGASPRRTFVIGNLKFDVESSPAVSADGGRMRANLFPGRPIWVAASTHAGEEEMLLEAQRLIVEEISDALLVLIPRHPDRFDGVADVIKASGFDVRRRSESLPATAAHSVFLGDTMGEVMQFYAAGDVAFVGGSLVPIGGHNLLEPASLAKPVVSGPHSFNAEDIALRLQNADALVTVDSPAELATTMISLLNDPATRHELGQRALTVIENNRGALKDLLDLLEPLISRPLGHRRLV